MAFNYNNGNREDFLRPQWLYIERQPENLEELRAARRAAIAAIREASPYIQNEATVFIGSTQLFCDLDLLMKCCQYFQDGNPGYAYGLPERIVSLETFVILYKWMANPSEVVQPSQLVLVYRAALYLQIDVLVDQFMDEFYDSRSAREEIGFCILYGLCNLNIYMPGRNTIRVHKFFLTMIGMKEFLYLPIDVLIGIFSSPDICVNSELEVLIAIIVWLEFWDEGRYVYVEQLLRCIHFDCIPFQALNMLRQTGPSNGPTRLLFRPEFEGLFRQAPSHNNHVRFCQRRIWSIDPMCLYHHDIHCNNRNFITMSQFNEFHRMLKNSPQNHWWYRTQMSPYTHTCSNRLCHHATRA